MNKLKMMELEFLPLKLKNVLYDYDLDKIYEIRLRVNQPVKVNYCGEYKYLLNKAKEKVLCIKNDIDEIIKNVTEYSVYAHNEKIKNGYLYSPGGVRLGLCGECVYDNDKIITLKNISSINIRLPHNVAGCSNLFFKKIISKEKVCNTLIISPPLLGKTTLLKDVALKLNCLNLGNILIIDERGEFFEIVGDNIDKICFCDKTYAFQSGVRVMSPQIIIADELMGEKDWNYVLDACRSGVTVIASVHGYSIEDVKEKVYFNKDVFDRYIVIGNKIGNVIAVYNKAFNKI